MQGFFPATTYTKRPLPLIAKCGQCQLHLSCDNPKMPVSGKGRKGILILGESPGWNEMLQGKPFVGRAGEELESALARVGVDMRRDCWITKAVICRVAGREKKNKTPTSKHVEYCRPNLTNVLQQLKPNVVIVLGAVALESILMGIWTTSIGPIGRWVGWQIPCQSLNAWLCPTWHPSYVLRTENDKNHIVVKRYWEEHLAAACKHTRKPWKTVPDWESTVEVVTNTNRIPKILSQMIEDDPIIAIDIECDRIKPDSKDATIVSCSVNNGKRTISYPWMGGAIQATVDLLRSPVRKVLANEKYERRWMLSKYGIAIRNVVWDTMLAAHWIDNRPAISSLSFQSFVYLGIPKHNEHIEPYFKGRGGNGRNRIRELDRLTLLKYGSMDALIEWKLAMKQSRLMGVEL